MLEATTNRSERWCHFSHRSETDMRALLLAAAGRQTHCSCCALEGVVMTPTHAHPRSFKTNRHRLEISATTILQCKSLYASYPHGWNGHVRMKLAAAGRQTPQSCCAVEGVDMTPTHARPRSFKTKRHRLEISAKPFNMSWDLVHYTRVCEACEDKDTTREETTVDANGRHTK